MWSSAICFLATIASFAVQQGEGLQCYVCSSDVENRCADPYDGDKMHYHLTDCDHSRSATPYINNEPFCKKVVQTVNGETVVERSCAWFQRDDDPCARKYMKYNHKVDHCSTCHEDKCNGAATNYLAALALIASLAVAKYLA